MELDTNVFEKNRLTPEVEVKRRQPVRPGQLTCILRESRPIHSEVPIFLIVLMNLDGACIIQEPVRPFSPSTGLWSIETAK